MNLNDYASIAKIIIAFFSVLGFIISIYFSRRTLLELKRDRRLSNKPHLVFEIGGCKTQIEFKHLNDEPNSRVYPSLRGMNRRMANSFGILKNYGTGTAFEIEIQWKGEKVQIENKWIDVNSLLKEERKIYSLESNKFPTLQRHLGVNESTGLLHFPIFISKDFERKIQRVDGRLIVNYKNSFNEKLNTIQEYRIFPRYNKMEITVTFSDLIKMPVDSEYFLN